MRFPFQLVVFSRFVIFVAVNAALRQSGLKVVKTRVNFSKTF
jgi:hypothetical protein